MRGRAARPAHPPPVRRSRLAAAYRRAMRAVFLLVLLAGTYGAFAVSHYPAGQAAAAAATERLIAISGSLGLVVNEIEVEGRKTTDSATIMAALAAQRGTPILAVNPSGAKQQLEKLPWVRSAVIERRYPSTLFVRLVERRPLAVWQHNGKQELIDHDGEVIPVGDLSRFAKLPAVVGDDAAKPAAELLDMLGHEPELAAHVTAAVRVDGRRWNLRIDNAIDVLLPEEDAAGAWARLAALERQTSLLNREVRTVDLRLPDRLILRQVDAPPADVAPAKKAHAAGKNT